MPVKVYKGEPINISVKYESDPLVKYQKTYADIEEISMNIKANSALDDDDAFLEKLQTNGDVILDTVQHRFTMVIEDGDYTNIIPGEYEIVLAVKVTGITLFLELKIEDSKFIVTKDKNRS